MLRLTASVQFSSPYSSIRCGRRCVHGISPLFPLSASLSLYKCGPGGEIGHGTTFETVSFETLSVCRALFVRYRFLSAVFVRLFVFFFITKVSSEITLPQTSSSAVLIAFLVKSPIVHMFLMSFHHRLEFRYHVPLQTAVLCLSLAWIQPFCQTCSSDPAIMEKLQKVNSLFQKADLSMKFCAVRLQY